MDRELLVEVGCEEIPASWLPALTVQFGQKLDARLREFMRVNLEMEGYAVREASSAEEALEAIEDQAPELVLLDVVMPGVDGWQMLQRMQERHGVGAIPVIMFSGQVDATSANDAEERGARGFVGKPFDPQQLIERAKQLVPA